MELDWEGWVEGSALTPGLAIYVVNKWEVNVQCLRGARNISLEWPRKLGRGHMLALYYSQKN